MTVMDFRSQPISADPEGQLSHPEDEDVAAPEEAPSEPLGLVDDDRVGAAPGYEWTSKPPGAKP